MSGCFFFRAVPHEKSSLFRPEETALKICLLSLGELRCTAGAFETVLFAFLHTRVAGQEACLLEDRTKGFVILQKRSRKTVADGAGLAGHAAAGDAADDIELVGQFGQGEGLTNDELEGVKTEIIVDVAIIDGDLAGALIQSYASDGGLSPACAVISLCYFFFL